MFVCVTISQSCRFHHHHAFCSGNNIYISVSCRYLHSINCLHFFLLLILILPSVDIQILLTAVIFLLQKVFSVSVLAQTLLNTLFVSVSSSPQWDYSPVSSHGLLWFLLSNPVPVWMCTAYFRWWCPAIFTSQWTGSIRFSPLELVLVCCFRPFCNLFTLILLLLQALRSAVTVIDCS